MQARIGSYVHAQNGLAIEIVPETEAESAVLAAAWKHGHMETGYSDENPTVVTFLVRVFDTKAAEGDE
jgi:hypothetical protein